MRFSQLIFLILRTLSLTFIIFDINQVLFNVWSDFCSSNSKEITTITENSDVFLLKSKNKYTKLPEICKEKPHKELDIKDIFLKTTLNISCQKNNDLNSSLDIILGNILENLEIIIRSGLKVAQKIVEFSILPSVKAQTSQTKLSLSEYTSEKIILDSATANLPNGNVVVAWKYKYPIQSGYQVVFSMTMVDINFKTLVNEKNFSTYYLDYPYPDPDDNIVIKLFSTGEFLILFQKQNKYSNLNYGYGLYRVALFDIQATIFSEFDLFNEICANSICQNRFGSIDILENDNIIILWENLANGVMGKVINKLGDAVVQDFNIGSKTNTVSIPINIYFNRAKVTSIKENHFVAVWFDSYDKNSTMLMRICKADGNFKTDIIKIVENTLFVRSYLRSLKNGNFLILFTYWERMFNNCKYDHRILEFSNLGESLWYYNANDDYDLGQPKGEINEVCLTYFENLLEIIELGNGNIVLFWQKTCKFFLYNGSSLTYQIPYSSHENKYSLGSLSGSNLFLEVYSEVILTKINLFLGTITISDSPIPMFNNIYNNLKFSPLVSTSKFPGNTFETCQLNDKLVVIEGGIDTNNNNKFQILIFNKDLKISKSIEIINPDYEEAISSSIICHEKSNEFILFVTSKKQVLSEYFIFAQRYDSQGATLGEKIQINENTIGAHTKAKAYYLKKEDQEKLFISWEYSTSNNMNFLYGRFLNFEGSLISAPLIISQIKSMEISDLKILVSEFDGNIFVFEGNKKILIWIINFEMQKLTANTYFPQYKNYGISDFPLVLDNGNILVIYGGKINFLRIFNFKNGSFSSPIFIGSNFYTFEITLKIISCIKLSGGMFIVFFSEDFYVVRQSAEVLTSYKFLQIINSNGGKIGEPLKIGIDLNPNRKYDINYLGSDRISIHYRFEFWTHYKSISYPLLIS